MIVFPEKWYLSTHSCSLRDGAIINSRSLMCVAIQMNPAVEVPTTKEGWRELPSFRCCSHWIHQPSTEMSIILDVSLIQSILWCVDVCHDFLQQRSELIGSVSIAEAVRLQKAIIIKNMSLFFSPPSSGLQGCRRFQSSAVNYSTMLLEADRERLYVGARGAVFALNASDISASSARTVSLFCFYVVACCAPLLPYFQFSNGFICIPQHRNFLKQHYFILRQKYSFPCHPFCVCAYIYIYMCV